MPKFCLLAFIAITSAALVSAAVPPVERLEGDSVSESGPLSYDDNPYLRDDNPYAPASDGDSDLGEQIILRREHKRAPIRVRADSFLFWSDNITSASNNEQDGWYFGGSVSARWRQRLTPIFFFDAYAYQDAYLYDRDNLDFQSTEFGAGFVATPKFQNVDDLTLYARYEFLYIHADNPLFGVLNPNEHLDSRYHRFRIGAHKPLYSRPGHMVSASTNASWDFDANSGTQRRQQISGRLAYTWGATDRLRVTTFYRASYRDYLGSNREDWNHYLGVEVNYTIAKWAEAYSSLLYGVNESNTAGGANDYDAFQAGLGVGIRLSF